MLNGKIKNAAHARNYGVSELMLATMTGRYPPPHTEMDQRWADQESQHHAAELEREMQEEQDWFNMVFARAYPDG